MISSQPSFSLRQTIRQPARPFDNDFADEANETRQSLDRQRSFIDMLGVAEMQLAKLAE